MLGIRNNELFLSQPDPEWKKSFLREQSTLEQILGDKVVEIEHIGSTAIAGIKAKPLVDILVGLRTMDDFKSFEHKKLNKEGYYHLGRVNIEGKEVVAKFSDLENLEKTHIVHIVKYQGEWWKAHVEFRDRLNQDEALAKEYEHLKLELAEKFPDDQMAYSEAKKTFVDRILNS
ncbi:hypothetical protein CEY16_11185 [Halalkalibacillus sediminis]|uniref:GrpB family protein n=1 Tax=Halalkalibacillus sediminis TaxID=2018042 RepID=A0A2I0QSI3_9BACI|nr:GrpB family protein [Halalkalibacillus sediminis]PKR77293.1 hypothetical protein CEY16_11185 [Halalkalibacillus sediminis]